MSHVYVKKRKIKQEEEQKPAQSKLQKKLMFQNRGIIDVTNFDAMTPDDPLGYARSGVIQLYSDGNLIIYSAVGAELLENINLTDVILGSDNLNNYDSMYITSISLMTREKNIRIDFRTIDIKKEFWDYCTTIYDNLNIN